MDSSEPAQPHADDRNKAQSVGPSLDQSDTLPTRAVAVKPPDDLPADGVAASDDDDNDECMLSESDIDEETELLIQQELRHSQIVMSGSSSPVPPSLAVTVDNPHQSLVEQTKLDPASHAPHGALSVEAVPKGEEPRSNELVSTPALGLPDTSRASADVDVPDVLQTSIHVDAEGANTSVDLTLAKFSEAVLEDMPASLPAILQLVTDGHTSSVVQMADPSAPDTAVPKTPSSSSIPLSIPIPSEAGEKGASEDQKHIEELDTITPQIISAAQHKSDLLFKLEQSALLLAAERRAALETTTRFHSCRRELANLSSSAETQLRVRLEVERDRTTAFTLRSAYQISMLKRLLSGVANHKAQSESAREVAIVRTNTARHVLPGLLERLREAEEYVNGLEAAYRQELDRGALLRQRIEDLDAAERTQREENARRAHLKSWQMGTEMLRQLAVKPAATATQAELAKSSTNVNAGDGAVDGQVEDTKQSSASPMLELDMSAFDDLKLVRATKLGIGELRGLERCNNTYAMDLSENCIENLGFLSYAPKLKLLNLSNNRIIDTSILEDLSGLMWLNLSYNPTITQLVLPTQFFFLVILDVSYCSLDGIPELNLPVLSHLNVSGNRLTELRVPSWLPLLQTLLVEENGIQMIWPLENVPLLENLSLRNNRIHDPVELLSLATCPKLRTINLDDNEVLGHPRMWIVRQLLPQLPLDMSLALKPPTDPIKLEDEVYHVLLSSLYHRYNLTKDPLRPGDDEILNRVLKDAEGLSKRMGNIHTYFKDVMTILHTDDSQPPADAPSPAGSAEEASSSTTSANEVVESTASREANAYSQLTALCRLCLDGNLPDVSHAVYHRARAPFLSAFMPLHTARFQAQCRGFLVRHWVVKAILAVVLIQRAWRDYLIAKAHRILMARIRAATRIQAVWRGFRVRRILDFIRGERDVHTPPKVEQDHELEGLDELLNLEPESNLDQLLTTDSLTELNRAATLLNPLGMSRSGSYNLLGLPRSSSFDRSRSGSLNALNSSRSNMSLSASRSKSGSGTTGLGGDGTNDDGDDKGGSGQNGRGRVGFKLGGLKRANADASSANTRARRQTSELAVKHVGRQYNGLAYGLGAQMASMLGAPATIDVVESRKDGSETVKLIKLRKKQMEAFARHIMGQDAAPVQSAPRPNVKPTHPPASPSKPNSRASTRHTPALQRLSPKKQHAVKPAASLVAGSIAPTLHTEAAIKADEQASPMAATGVEDVDISSAPDAKSDSAPAPPVTTSVLDESQTSNASVVQPDYKDLEDSNLLTFISTQPNLIEALEVPEGSPMHWIRTLRKSSVRGSRQPTPASLLASVAASRSRMASQQRGSTSGSLPPPSPLPLPEGDEDVDPLNHQPLPETVPEVPDETELAAFTDMLSTNVLEKIRKQLSSQAARDMDQLAPAPIQYAWETDLDAPIKRVWANEPERDVDIRPVRPEVELIKQTLAAKLRLSRRKAQSRSRNRNVGQADRYHPSDVVLPILPPSAMVVAPLPFGQTKAASEEVAVDREAIMHIIKYGTPIRLP